MTIHSWFVPSAQQKVVLPSKTPDSSRQASDNASLVDLVNEAESSPSGSLASITPTAGGEAGKTRKVVNWTNAVKVLGVVAVAAGIGIGVAVGVAATVTGIAPALIGAAAAIAVLVAGLYFMYLGLTNNRQFDHIISASTGAEPITPTDTSTKTGPAADTSKEAAAAKLAQEAASAVKSAAAAMGIQKATPLEMATMKVVKELDFLEYSMSTSNSAQVLVDRKSVKRAIDALRPLYIADVLSHGWVIANQRLENAVTQTGKEEVAYSHNGFGANARGKLTIDLILLGKGENDKNDKRFDIGGGILRSKEVNIIAMLGEDIATRLEQNIANGMDLSEALEDFEKAKNNAKLNDAKFDEEVEKVIHQKLSAHFEGESRDTLIDLAAKAASTAFKREGSVLDAHMIVEDLTDKLINAGALSLDEGVDFFKTALAKIQNVIDAKTNEVEAQAKAIKAATQAKVNEANTSLSGLYTQGALLAGELAVKYELLIELYELKLGIAPGFKMQQGLQRVSSLANARKNVDEALKLFKTSAESSIEETIAKIKELRGRLAENENEISGTKEVLRSLAAPNLVNPNNSQMQVEHLQTLSNRVDELQAQIARQFRVSVESLVNPDGKVSTSVAVPAQPAKPTVPPRPRKGYFSLMSRPLPVVPPVAETVVQKQPALAVTLPAPATQPALAATTAATLKVKGRRVSFDPSLPESPIAEEQPAVVVTLPASTSKSTPFTENLYVNNKEAAQLAMQYAKLQQQLSVKIGSNAKSESKE